jgi:hypothetical protein
LTEKIDFSGLVCTRKEGAQLQLEKKSSVPICSEKSVLDLIALWKLRRYVKQNKVGLLHVHSNFLFYGTSTKIDLSICKTNYLTIMDRVNSWLKK